MKEYVSTEELERQRIKPRRLVTFDSASDAAAFVEAAMPAPELIAFSEHGEHSDEAG
jgi:hypothetical protein